MTNLRTYKSVKLTSGSIATCNYSGSTYNSVWGILRGASGAGSITLEGSGTIDIADISVGIPFPCYPVHVSVSGGSVYILS